MLILLITFGILLILNVYKRNLNSNKLKTLPDKIGGLSKLTAL